MLLVVWAGPGLKLAPAGMDNGPASRKTETENAQRDGKLKAKRMFFELCGVKGKAIAIPGCCGIALIAGKVCGNSCPADSVCVYAQGVPKGLEDCLLSGKEIQKWNTRNNHCKGLGHWNWQDCRNSSRFT